MSILLKRTHIIKKPIVKGVATYVFNKKENEFDIAIVGGGIVGVATARELAKRYRGLSMAIIEKEGKLAQHQSGHNSGVIHSGIYYKPGTLKAKLCLEGLYLSYQYFDEKRIPYKKVGKLIVATDANEVQLLDDLYKRGLENRVPDLQLIEGSDIQAIEPYCRGLKAIWSPNTGIVDWAEVTRHYAKDFQSFGGKIYLNFKVDELDESHDSEYPIKIVSDENDVITAKYVVTCAGLQSDEVAKLSGCCSEPKIVPFRGEYLLLSPEKAHMIKGNIYPVPNPKLPFLGVHFTPRMDGSVWLGPNAILAFKREGYKFTDFNLRECFDALSYKGFQRLAYKHLGSGLRELLNTSFLNLQVKELRKFVPDITRKDVQRGPAGVRAQALDVDGNLLDDYHIDVVGVDSKNRGKDKRILHCRNAPSPGATSSLAIARMLADEVRDKLLH